MIDYMLAATIMQQSEFSRRERRRLHRALIDGDRDAQPRRSRRWFVASRGWIRR